MSNRLDGPPLNPISEDWEEPRQEPPTRQGSPEGTPDKKLSQGVSMSQRTWALLDQYVKDHYDNRSRVIERLVNLMLEGKISLGSTVVSEGRRPL